MVTTQVGDAVAVREEHLAASRWRKPHLRVPGYLFGARGVVERVCGAFPDPEALAFGEPATSQNLYRVRFDRAALWPEGGSARTGDTVDVEVYESWLARPEDVAAAPVPAFSPRSGEVAAAAATNAFARAAGGTDANAGTDAEAFWADHDHAHAHAHASREEAEAAAIDEEGPETPARRLADALVAALAERGVVTRDELRTTVEKLDSLGRDPAGPRLVARAWVDDGFRARLLADATAAAAELGIVAANSTARTSVPWVAATPQQRRGHSEKRSHRRRPC